MIGKKIFIVFILFIFVFILFIDADEMRENREKVKDADVFPGTTESDDWLPWTSWEALRFPPAKIMPTVDKSLKDIQGIYELAVYEESNHERIAVYLGYGANLYYCLKLYQGDKNHKLLKIENILVHGLTLEVRYREKIGTPLMNEKKPVS